MEEFNKFQFQTGAIKSLVGRHREHREISFQFQTGAIKRHTQCLRVCPRARFQFQTGAIKRTATDSPRPFGDCFNSKLVRLKGNSSRLPVSSHTFQFQTGAIKSKVSYTIPSLVTCFNSKLVRLKVAVDMVYPNLPIDSFNSKLVRLKGGIYDKVIRCPTFQFQTGAIKRNEVRYLAAFKRGFNSKLVRLKESGVEVKECIPKRFQFQTGAIKRHLRIGERGVDDLFQFQTGAIKSCRGNAH